MSIENPLWGAPRIHGELLVLGIKVAESTVGRYVVRRRHPPSQGWKTFLRNHAAGTASIDLFVVRTISFKLLYGNALSLPVSMDFTTIMSDSEFSVRTGACDSSAPMSLPLKGASLVSVALRSSSRVDIESNLKF